MAEITWVRTTPGTPVEDNFGGTFGKGTPVVIDEATDTPYYLKSGVVTAFAGGGSGTVTSVGLSAPAIFSVSGSPVTTSGTLALSLASQSANLFFASPDGAPGAPIFRAIVAADVPTLNQNTTGSAATLTTTRSISISGDLVWTVNFNGSANVTAAGTIQNGVVTLAKIANAAASSKLLGSGATGAGSSYSEITLGTGLSMSGTTLNVSGGAGDVVGPGSATDNAVARFDTTTGKLIQNSNFLVNDAGIPAVTCQTGVAGAIGPAIADYFSATLSLDASSTYEIECVAYFLKTTAGTVTFTWTFSSAPTVVSSFFTGSAATGFTTANVNGTVVHGQAHRQANTTVAHAATGSLTTAVYHSYRFRVFVRTNAATTIQLRATESAGTITPQTGSYMRATKII